MYQSSANDNASIVRRAHECFNNRDYSCAMDLVSSDAEVIDYPTQTTRCGPEGFKEALQSWATAFPDSKSEVKSVICSDHSCAVEFVASGTHSGPLSTPNGDIPPTGHSVEVPFVEVDDFQDGKIVQSRLYYDTGTFMRQLGMMS